MPGATRAHVRRGVARLGRMAGMDFHSATHYPAAPSKVRALHLRKAFWERVCAETDSLRYDVTVDGDTVHVNRAFRSPSSVARFVGPELALEETMAWTGDDCVHRIVVPHMPVTFDGTLTLRPAEGGSEVVYDGVLKVAIPVLGPVMETQAMPLVRMAVETTERVGREMLTHAD